jgi:MIP family channel proteins
MNIPLQNRIIAEAFGTFALVFAGAGAIVVNTATGGAITHVGIAITFGLVVLAMIYAIGDVSGAHINPAVTLGFYFAGRLPGASVIPYIVAQCGGAIGAAFLLRALFPSDEFLGTTSPSGTQWQALAFEGVMTMFLMFVILSVSTGAKEKGITAGIAVGATIGLDAMFGGPISGASMNPARSLGPAIISTHVKDLWVYLVGPIVGSIAAIPLFLATRAAVVEEQPKQDRKR